MVMVAFSCVERPLVIDLQELKRYSTIQHLKKERKKNSSAFFSKSIHYSLIKHCIGLSNQINFANELISSSRITNETLGITLNVHLLPQISQKYASVIAIDFQTYVLNKIHILNCLTFEEASLFCFFSNKETFRC